MGVGEAGDGDEGAPVEHGLVDGGAEALHRTPETDIILYTNYLQLNTKTKNLRWLPRLTSHWSRMVFLRLHLESFRTREDEETRNSDHMPTMVTIPNTLRTRKRPAKFHSDMGCV